MRRMILTVSIGLAAVFGGRAILTGWPEAPAATGESAPELATVAPPTVTRRPPDPPTPPPPRRTDRRPAKVPSASAMRAPSGRRRLSGRRRHRGPASGSQGGSSLPGGQRGQGDAARGRGPPAQARGRADGFDDRLAAHRDDHRVR